MKDNKRMLGIMTVTIVCFIIMAFIDGVIKPDYFIKSAWKILFFLALPVLYALFDKKVDIKGIFRANLKGIKIAFALGISVFSVILSAFFLLRGVFDFSGITKALEQNVGVSKNNFIFVSTYIAFVNSFLEEFLFRGFAFLKLKEVIDVKYASVFSAAVFSLYHVAIMVGWFSLFPFLLVMVGLFLGGLIFNYLNFKFDNIYSSWLVHMFANFSINIIGFILFGVI